MANQLGPDQALTEVLTSANGQFALTYQPDGNLVLYRNDGLPLWASQTVGSTPGIVVMQGDGNCVLYDGRGTPLWATGTFVPGSRLFLQDDANLLVLDPTDVPIWASQTAQVVAPGEPEQPSDPSVDYTIIVIHDQRGRPVEGALVQQSNGDARIADGSGFTHMSSHGTNHFIITHETIEPVEIDLGQGTFVVQAYRLGPKHPQPVIGRIRAHGFETFKDDTGAKVFSIVHMGDLVARWMYARNEEDRNKILRDLDDAAESGYHIVRAWWHLDVDHWPWNQGGDPPYPGVSTERTPDFVAKGVALAREVAARGMRITIGAGGIGRMNAGQEEQMARTLHEVVIQAGSENFAWAEAVNEPSSTHATSDNDGDNQPANLTKLARIISGDTGLMWHLGYGDNNNYRESGRYTVEGMSYNYVHSWRRGNVFNKIDRRFTWCRVFAGESGKANGRLTIDGESCGWPVNGPPLRHVSATENGHELNSNEALALIACATAVRGMPSHMSGTGVQRYEPFTNTVGWTHIPWLLRQLPQDIATFDLVHGGMGDGRVLIEATTNGNGVLGRADQAVAHDGRFVAILYNQHANQDQAFRFRKSASFICIDTESMTWTEHTVRAGERFNVRMFWGKVLVGHLI